MNIQTALLPHKHTTFSESLLGTAGLLRSLLVEPRSIDELWSMVQTDAESWPARPSFTEVLLAVDLLFCIGQVSPSRDGRVRRRVETPSTNL
jgi:hypothetical protein